MADGHVIWLRNSIASTTYTAIFTIKGSEPAFNIDE